LILRVDLQFFLRIKFTITRLTAVCSEILADLLNPITTATHPGSACSLTGLRLPEPHLHQYLWLGPVLPGSNATDPLRTYPVAEPELFQLTLKSIKAV
jgi:hypothetical protein